MVEHKEIEALVHVFGSVIVFDDTAIEVWSANAREKEMYGDKTVINEDTQLINDLDLYAMDAQKTAVYPSQKALEYLTLGLTGEAGELANKVKKVLRGDYEGKGAKTWDDVRAAILDECGDVLWYLSQLVLILDYKLSDVASDNLAKLRRRKAEGVVKGDGDNR